MKLILRTLIKTTLVSDTLCTLCSQDNVEDEYHFLIHCLKYSSLRTDFFNNIGYVATLLMSDLDCVKFLLTKFPRQTAKFINSAYMYRQSILYRNRNAYFLCIYLQSVTVTYRSDGPGVYYYYILSIVCICNNTCH